MTLTHGILIYLSIGFILSVVYRIVSQKTLPVVTYLILILAWGVLYPLTFIAHLLKKEI